VPANQLSPAEAGELLRVLRASGTRHDDLRASAYQKLKQIAEGIEIPDTPYVALVTVIDSGVCVICGEVALVDFQNLADPDCDEPAHEVDELAERIECDLSDLASETVKHLRAIAQQRRVAALRSGDYVERCTLAQLNAAVDAAGVDPNQARVNAAVVCASD
jgi:hypothetical protein